MELEFAEEWQRGVLQAPTSCTSTRPQNAHPQVLPQPSSFFPNASGNDQSLFKRCKLRIQNDQTRPSTNGIPYGYYLRPTTWKNSNLYHTISVRSLDIVVRSTLAHITRSPTHPSSYRPHPDFSVLPLLNCTHELRSYCRFRRTKGSPGGQTDQPDRESQCGAVDHACMRTCDCPARLGGRAKKAHAVREILPRVGTSFPSSVLQGQSACRGAVMTQCAGRLLRV